MELAKLFASLVLIVVLILAAGFFVKRLGVVSGSVGTGMRVISTLSLGQKDRLVVVDAYGQKLLLSVSTTNGVVALHEFSADADFNVEAADSPRPRTETGNVAATFAAILKGQR